MLAAITGASADADGKGEGGGDSLAKMLLKTRGSEIIRKTQAMTFLRASVSTKEKLPCTIVPTDGSAEHVYEFEGNEKLNSVKFNLATNYKWDGCDLHFSDVRGYTKEVNTSDELAVLVETFRAREEVRRIDVLEGSLETVRSMLLASRPEMHLRGCLSLWRLASNRSQHGQVGASVFMLLPKVLKSTDVHVSRVAAAAVWALAQEEATLRRIPAELFVKALTQVKALSKAVEGGRSSDLN